MKIRDQIKNEKISMKMEEDEIKNDIF